MTGQQRTSGAGLGTVAGVFTPSILTILGIVLFLRLGYVVGVSGLDRALLIIAMANTISVLTTFSLSAIATNFQVKGGGDYYLISRTLGLGFGGAIGIVLFLAQSVSIGFYCVGFGEIIAAMVPAAGPLAVPMVAMIAIAALFALAWVGMDWAAKFQYAIMALMALALLSFALGAVGHWNVDLLAANWSQPPSVDLWVAFAVFFPAVTGFTQGVSLSGDLRDPGKSIPAGTFAAVIVSIAIYLLAAVLLAGANPPATLIEDYTALQKTGISGWLISLGIIAAALSSALASFLGAPRILQALAKDRIFPLLRPFGRGVGPGANPRRGVMLSGAIALLVAVLGDLNAVAQVVSMFFLASYGLVNYATYYEAKAASPSFRPTFRWYTPALSLAGMIACAGAMLAINAAAAAAAIALLAGVMQYLKFRGAGARWADNRRSHSLQRVRHHLLAAARELEHPRDWRPYILAFSDSAERRAPLLRFANWIEGGSGLTTVVRVLIGEGSPVIRQRDEAIAALRQELRQAGSSAFPLVISAPSIEVAAPILAQSVGIGPIRTNTVLVNWLEESDGLPQDWDDTRYGQNLRMAFRLGCNLLILRAAADAWATLDACPVPDRRIDVWWHADASGELMLLLAYLMTRDPQWRDAAVRLLVPVLPDHREGRLQAVRELLAAARIDADPVPVESADTESMLEHSRGASLVMLRVAIREGRLLDSFGKPMQAVAERLPLAVMAMAARSVELDAQPDVGGAGDAAAALDRFVDAGRRLAKLQTLARDTEAAAAQARQALADAAEPERETLQAQLARAEQEAREAVRRLAKAQAKLQDAEQELQRLGIEQHASKAGAPRDESTAAS